MTYHAWICGGGGSGSGEAKCTRGSHSHLVPSRCDTSEKIILKIEQKHSLKQKKWGLPCYNISPRWRENPPCPHHGCGLGEGYRTSTRARTRMHPCPRPARVYKPVTFPIYNRFTIIYNPFTIIYNPFTTIYNWFTTHLQSFTPHLQSFATHLQSFTTMGIYKHLQPITNNLQSMTITTTTFTIPLTINYNALQND